MKVCSRKGRGHFNEVVETRSPCLDHCRSFLPVTKELSSDISCRRLRQVLSAMRHHHPDVAISFGEGKRIMKRWPVIFALLVLSPCSEAISLDPGYARGTLTAANRTVSLSHSSVMLFGNEEGVLERQELRILLADRPVPEAVLSGPFLQLFEKMVKNGDLQGVLLRLDARRPTGSSVHGTLLLPSQSGGVSLQSFVIEERGGGFQRFEMGNNRVWGQTSWSFKGGPLLSMGYHATFSAPLFRDVVTARHLGKASRGSPQVAAMLAFERVLREGKLEEMERYATKERLEAVKAYMKQVGAEAFLDEIRENIPPEEIRRRGIIGVYVRGKTASVIYREGKDKRVLSMVDENGTWRVD